MPGYLVSRLLSLLWWLPFLLRFSKRLFIFIPLLLAKPWWGFPSLPNWLFWLSWLTSLLSLPGRFDFFFLWLFLRVLGSWLDWHALIFSCELTTEELRLSCSASRRSLISTSSYQSLRKKVILIPIVWRNKTFNLPMTLWYFPLLD